MTYDEKKKWLNENGLLSRSGYGSDSYGMKWTPWGDYDDDYYFESYANTMKQCITEVFEEAKETLFQDCNG